jgi:hypothetical protein
MMRDFWRVHVGRAAKMAMFPYTGALADKREDIERADGMSLDDAWRVQVLPYG